MPTFVCHRLKHWTGGHNSAFYPSSQCHKEMWNSTFRLLLFPHIVLNRLRPIILAAPCILDGVHKGASRPAARLFHAHHGGHHRNRGPYLHQKGAPHHPRGSWPSCAHQLRSSRPLPFSIKSAALTSEYLLQHRRSFHATVTCNAPPVVAVLLGLLKVHSST